MRKNPHNRADREKIAGIRMSGMPICRPMAGRMDCIPVLPKAMVIDRQKMMAKEDGARGPKAIFDKAGATPLPPAVVETIVKRVPDNWAYPIGHLEGTIETQARFRNVGMVGPAQTA